MSWVTFSNFPHQKVFSLSKKLFQRVASFPKCLTFSLWMIWIWYIFVLVKWFVNVLVYCNRIIGTMYDSIWLVQPFLHNISYLVTKSPLCSNQPICTGCSENDTLADGSLLFYVHLVILFVGLNHDDVSNWSISLCFVSELKFVSLSINIDSLSQSVTSH